MGERGPFVGRANRGRHHRQGHGFGGIQFGVLFMMSATPVAAASYVMVKAMGGNDVAAANIVGITTFGAMFVAALGLGLMKPLGWL